MIFCAEIGSNHKGIESLAFEMIRQAKLAGADIAKFQLHDIGDPIRGMPMRNIQEIVEFCAHFDIEFMASIFSLEGLAVARSVGMKRYKMASRKAFLSHSKLKYDELLDELRKDGKEIFVSSREPRGENIRNLWIVPEYPNYPPVHVPVFDGKPIWGYSSHAHGIEDALIAIARGAQYIEKHVTLDKTEESIKDNHFALSFDEFRQMVDIGRGMERVIRDSV